MGQKVNPNGLRLGVNKSWQSHWYADKDYAVKLNNDIKIREYLLKTLSDAAVSSVEIERRKDKVEVKIHTAKPGVIIGRGGEDIEKLRNSLKKVVNEDIYVIPVYQRPYAWTNENCIQLYNDIADMGYDKKAYFSNKLKKSIEDELNHNSQVIKQKVK